MLARKHTEFLTFNGKLYMVHRKIPKDSIKEEHVLDIRDAWHCDNVLKSNNRDTDVFVFLIEVLEAEIISESESTPSPEITSETSELPS